MYRYIFRKTFLLIAALATAGCTTTGSPGVSVSGARQPMSAQTPIGEAQQRAKVHYELGSLYLLDNRFAVAMEEARIALKVDSNYAPAYSLLGLAHMRLGENALAEENFTQALRHAPGDPEIFNNYGWFLCQSGREKQSIPYFLAAAGNPLYQTPSKPYTNAGICAVRLKDDKAAEEYLAQAMKLDAENTLALYWLADISYRQGRASEARQWVGELEKRMELPVEATWLALRIERKLGNRDGEARHTARMKKAFPGAPETRKMQQGDYE